MASSIDELVSMGDIQSLYEIMSVHDDWMIQLDAAEGLVKLHDRRGLEFLLSAEQSEDKEIQEIAKEILGSPEIERRVDDIRAEDEERRLKKIEVAKRRLQKGKKVFCYKMVYLPAGEILDEDPLSEGFYIPALNEFGFEGWEVVNIVPRRRQVLTGVMDDNISGAYFLLKREVAGDESDELK